MKACKHWKSVLLLSLLTALVIGAMGCAAGPVAQMQSPNGEIELSVYRTDGDSFMWEHSKGPDWSFSRCNIGGVTDFKMGAFSPDSRHGLLIFTDESGGERYHWTDYETGTSGGLSLESACKVEETFAQSIREEKGPWNSINFTFLDWHGSKNWMLFRYTFTTKDGAEYSGHFWFDPEARLEEDAVEILEMTD